MELEDETPDDPVVGVSRPIRGLLYPFLYFLHSFSHLTALEQSEGPMTIARGVGILRQAMKFRLTADVNGLRIKLVEVEQESEIRIREGEPSRIESNAPSPVLYCRVVKLELEIAEPYIIVKLGVIFLHTLCLLEGFDRIFIVTLLVKGDSIVEKAFERLILRGGRASKEVFCQGLE